MVSWDNAKVPQSADRKEIERLTFAIGDTKIRFIGDILPRYVRWVTTKEGKKMPVECLNYSRTKEEFDDNLEDPFKEIPEEAFSDKAQFAYVCNVIDRKDGNIKLCDLKKTIYTQVVGFACDPEYGNPASTEGGYDVTIKKEKTGPLPQNVKYTALPARTNSPLTSEETEMELFDLDRIFKRPTYAEQKAWLMENTFLFAGEEGDDFKPESAEDLD